MANEKMRKFLFPTEEDQIPKIKPQTQTFNLGFGNKGNAGVMVSDDLTDLTSVKSKYDSPYSYLNENQVNAGALSNASIYSPSSFEETEKIAKELIARKVIIVSLENLRSDEAKKATAIRVIDFLSGVAYASSIMIQKINSSTFIFSPIVQDLRK
jgi:FtsZ-interacting cell division protein YlmF